MKWRQQENTLKHDFIPMNHFNKAISCWGCIECGRNKNFLLSVDVSDGYSTTDAARALSTKLALHGCVLPLFLGPDPLSCAVAAWVDTPFSEWEAGVGEGKIKQKGVVRTSQHYLGFMSRRPTHQMLHYEFCTTKFSVPDPNVQTLRLLPGNGNFEP